MSSKGSSEETVATLRDFVGKIGKTGESIGSARRRGHVEDREARGVRAEDRRGRTDRVELGEELLLRADLLDYRLDHQIAVLEVGERRRAPEAAACRFGVLFGRATALYQPSERTVDPLETLIQERLIDLAHDRVDSRLRANLRDARTHLPEPDHAAPLNTHLTADLQLERCQH